MSALEDQMADQEEENSANKIWIDGFKPEDKPMEKESWLKYLIEKAGIAFKSVDAFEHGDTEKKEQASTPIRIKTAYFATRFLNYTRAAKLEEDWANMKFYKPIGNFAKGKGYPSRI